MYNDLKTVFLLLVGLTLFVQPIYAQSASLSLTISARDGKQVPDATVIFKVENFTTELIHKTDQSGKLKIKTLKGYKYQINIRHIAFRDTTFSFFQQEDKQFLSIFLERHSTELAEVKIIAESPIAMKKDTLEYVAKYFKSGHEQNLEDLAKKLPGLEVNNKGEIIYKGKKIEKVMVDGREFFGSNVKMATKNIPASVIEKLQVIENYSDNSVAGMTGSSGKNALNIVLDENKKNIVFGEGSFAAGFNDRTQAELKSFYFNKKLDIGIINNYNNVGLEVFNTEDYLNFYGGIENIVKSGSADQALKLPSLLFSDKDKAYLNQNLVNSININYKPTDKLKLNGFGILSRNKSGYNSDESTTFFSNNYKMYENKQSILHKNITIGQVNVEFIPNNETFIKYTANHNHFQSDQNFDLLSKIQESSFEVFANAKNYTNTTTNQASIHHSVNNSLIFSGQINYEVHSGQQSYMTAKAGSKILREILDIEKNDLESIFQQQKQSGRKFDAQLSLYKILSRNNHLKFQIGYSQSTDYLNTLLTLNDTLDNEETVIDPLYTNNTKYVISDKNTGLYYIHQSGILTYNIGFTAHANNINSGKPNFTCQPDLTVKINWRNSRQLRINYKIENKLASINDLGKGYIVEDYRTVSKGNDSLKNSLYHTISANYLDINLYSFTNLNLYAAYSRRIRNIRNRTEIDNFGQFLIPENNTPENYFISTATFSKRINRLFELKYKASGMLNSFSYRLDNENYLYRSFEFDNTISLTTYIKKDMITEIGIAYKNEKYTTNALSSKYSTTKPFLNIEVSLPFSINIRTEYNINVFRELSGNTTNVYSLLSASVQKKIKKFTVEISGRNLFNTENIYRNSFHENSITTASYLMLPRTILISVGYKF